MYPVSTPHCTIPLDNDMQAAVVVAPLFLSVMKLPLVKCLGLIPVGFLVLLLLLSLLL